MPDIREEFEAYVLGLFPSDRPLARNEMVYLNPHIQQRWLGWQASRAALRVELPDNSARAGSDPYQDGYYACREEVEEALQQAGIEAKQP